MGEQRSTGAKRPRGAASDIAASAGVDLEALPALFLVRDEAVTPSNAQARARGLGPDEEAALLAAARHTAASGARACLRRERRDEGGAFALLLSAPTARGVQVLVLDCSWSFDGGGLLRLAPGLTPRERQVVELAAQGFGPSHIAERLHVTWHTARSHLRNAYRALGVSERLELLKLGQRLLVPEVEGWPSAGVGP